MLTHRDPLGPPVSTWISIDGKTLNVRGILTAGDGSKITSILDSNKSVSTIHLDSPGGRPVEALIIANFVIEHKLNTSVNRKCSSACTIIFIAGYSRQLAREAKLGFHGVSASTREATTAGRVFMMKYYAKRNIDGRFIELISSMPTTEIYYPSNEELVKYNIIRPVPIQLLFNSHSGDTILNCQGSGSGIA